MICCGKPSFQLCGEGRRWRQGQKTEAFMLKLLGFIVAAIPVVLFLRAIFGGMLKRRSQSMSEFKKQMDYLVTVILFCIAVAVVFTVGKLIYQGLN
jgi:threonine/homoserine/homoserine lactone efflux protein